MLAAAVVTPFPGGNSRGSQPPWREASPPRPLSSKKSVVCQTSGGSFHNPQLRKKHRPLVTTMLREPSRGFARAPLLILAAFLPDVDRAQQTSLPNSGLLCLLPCCAVRPGCLRRPGGAKQLASGQRFAACAHGLLGTDLEVLTRACACGSMAGLEDDCQVRSDSGPVRC